MAAWGECLSSLEEVTLLKIRPQALSDGSFGRASVSRVMFLAWSTTQRNWPSKALGGIKSGMIQL